MDLQSERLDSIHYTAWRTDRYRRFLPELALKSCKELKNELMIRTNPTAQSAADRLEKMMYSANLNRNIVESYLEELGERRDALREGQLEEAKMEDYRREILKSRLSHQEQRRAPAALKETPQEQEESRFVLLNEMPVEKYGKKDKKKLSIKRDSTQSSIVRNKNRTVSPVFFTESPDKPTCAKKECDEERWGPLSYTAMGDMGFNFRVAPGKGQLWGKTAKMWKPIS